MDAVHPRTSVVPDVHRYIAAQVVMAAWAAVLLIFSGTVGSLVEAWSESRTFAHGFLVFPAGLYLIWCYRDHWTAVAPRPNYLGFLGLLVLGCGWLFGSFLDILLLEQVTVVAMLPALMWTTVGSGAVRSVLFPLGFFFFALPFGTSLEPGLQVFTAWFVVTGLEFFGVPVYWEGDFLTLPSRTWEVARDCGGLRYILPGMALGYLFTAMIYHKPIQRGLFLVVCLIALIVANGLRAFGIILGDHFGIAEGTDHRVFSYTVYGLTVLILSWLGLRWRAAQDEAPLSRMPAGRMEPPVTGAPQAAASPLAMSMAALGGVALLALAPVFAWFYRLMH